VFTDLSTVDPSDITVTTNSLGGVTTKYFIPSEHLPLVELLPFLEPQEAFLKQIVDSAYKRNDAQSAATIPAPAAAVEVANTADSVAVAAPAAPEAVAPASVASAKTPEVSVPAETVAARQSVPAAEPTNDPAPVAEPTNDPTPVAEPTNDPTPVAEPTTDPTPVAEPTNDPTPVADALDTATENPAASSVDAPQPTGRRAANTRSSDGSGETHRTSGNTARSAASSRADKSPSE
jgi:hypothetical protein